MKKMLLSLLFAAGTVACAQTFDETQLVGKWENSAMTTGNALGLISWEAIELGDATYTLRDYDRNEDYIRDCAGVLRHATIRDADYDGEAYEYVEDMYILDYFISNGNKLHIIVGDDFSLRFVLESLTEEELGVKSFDGTRAFVMKKAPDTGINSVSPQPASRGGAYNLRGQRLRDVRSEKVYIRDGKKLSRR